jgi:hypothetical protein
MVWIDVNAIHRTALRTRVIDGNHCFYYRRARPFRRSTGQDKCELAFSARIVNLAVSPQVRVCRFWKR